MKDLYYILMYNNLGNVKECKTLIKHGLIQVNGVVETNCKRKIQEEDVLIYQGKMLKSQPFHYLMLNKPQGYLCANKDEKEKCVVDLIDYPDCFCLGRLDRDTTGLLILTNDKSLKKLLLPQNHVKKTYLVETKERLKKEDQEAFKRGIIIDQKIGFLYKIVLLVDHALKQVNVFLMIVSMNLPQWQKILMALSLEHLFIMHIQQVKFKALWIVFFIVLNLHLFINQQL